MRYFNPLLMEYGTASEVVTGNPAQGKAGSCLEVNDHSHTSSASAYEVDE
jgi:hypothetical protein